MFLSPIVLKRRSFSIALNFRNEKSSQRAKSGGREAGGEQGEGTGSNFWYKSGELTG